MLLIKFVTEASALSAFFVKTFRCLSLMLGSAASAFVLKVRTYHHKQSLKIDP